jgi:polyhydroxyalkanoate synthase
MTRTGPRPLALHLATEAWIVQAAMMGLAPFWPGSKPSSNASPRSSQSPPSTLNPWADPARQIAAAAVGKNPEAIDRPWPAYLDAAKFLDAVIAAGALRMQGFLEGVQRYQNHRSTRTLASPPPVWTRGAAALRDYGGEGAAVVFVPSLINRATILDLAEDRSLLRAAAGAGLHTFLLDWGEPGLAERAFTLTDYVAGVLIPALAFVKAQTGAAPKVVGYCMGGTLAVAPAVLRPDLVRALALLAAPWDFHADSGAARAMMELSRPLLSLMIDAEGAASVDLLQALFVTLDPTLVGRKFRRFAALDPASEEAGRFVALEDWLNDGVPLAGPVARECMFAWYGNNTPANGAWEIGGTPVDPGNVRCPALAFIPNHDRIVPPKSATALAAAIAGAEVRTVDLGHIGMIAGGSALKRVYAPLLAWLKG